MFYQKVVPLGLYFMEKFSIYYKNVPPGIYLINQISILKLFKSQGEDLLVEDITQVLYSPVGTTFWLKPITSFLKILG